MVERTEPVQHHHWFFCIEGILVLLHGEPQEVTVVMQNDAEDGNASQRLRFRYAQ